MSLIEIMSTLNRCTERVHKWGEVNRVNFDADKQHIVVIHPRENHGDCFKLLGCMIDPNLTMRTQIEQLLSKIQSKSRAILRTRAYYDIPELLLQYKTHVWGLVECHCGGYYHAATSLLDRVDQVQFNFLAKLGLSEQQAFLEFNLAPTVLRRDVAVLGLLHKRVLGNSHRTLEKLLPFYSDRFDTSRGFGHTKQLCGQWLEATHYPSLFRRSIFQMVDLYNNFPQYVVDAPSVSVFQRFLTQQVREKCRQGDPLWRFYFNRRSRISVPDSDSDLIELE